MNLIKFKILLRGMQNKKTFILGIIAIVILIGVVWYASSNKDEIIKQTASIFNLSGENGKVTELDGDFIFGNPSAPVTIIEYSSHLCGACSNFHSQTFPSIVEDYVKTGKVRIIPRLISHPALGVAVLCAQEQNAFLEFNEYIFENIENIQTVEAIKEIASELGLNKDSFSQCFDSDKYQEQVMKWFEQAEEDEIESTPTFLINGQEIVGSQPYITFKNAIESQLNK